jgi:nucleotide-binding universal stress UspA family protein
LILYYTPSQKVVKSAPAILSWLCHSLVTTFIIPMGYSLTSTPSIAHSGVDRVPTAWEVSHISDSGRNLTWHLALDDPTLVPALARRLPPDLAFRYHALPVAEDKGTITVAMADPDDAAAREAIAAALGARSYVVRGAPERIDALLAEIWPEVAHPALHWLVCAPAGGAQAYVQYIDGLLGSRPDSLASGEDLIEQARHGCELVLLWEPDLDLVEQVLSNTGDAACPALLAVWRPRLPLKKMLLIVGGEASEDISVRWAVRLARPSDAAVTVLAVAPAAPRAARGTTHLERGMPALLATDTALGRQMRRVARRLQNWGIDGRLRLREGSLGQQVQLEVAAEDYDMIIAAAEPVDGGLPGEMIGPLLWQADRPLLVTGASQAVAAISNRGAARNVTGAIEDRAYK